MIEANTLIFLRFMK